MLSDYIDIPVDGSEISNKCRNPDDKQNGLWCYVSETEWEYCDVPFCSGRIYTLFA